MLKDDKFSFVIVEDVMAEGAFDDHVKGVEGIVHTVGPSRPCTLDTRTE